MKRRPRRRAALAAASALLALVLSGCTGVPTSSSPETIETIGIGPQQPPAVGPPAGAAPRTIVDYFLAANGTDAQDRSAAREFLTPAARGRWSDSTVTVISNETVGNYVSRKHSITVRGQLIGTINASGVYLPVLQGDGSGGETVSFTFGFKRVGGEYRVDTLRNGLVLTDTEFDQTYQQHVVYFYDLAEHYLVPDPRYSAVTDGSVLANWLLDQLAAGPRPELQNAVSNELPAQSDARRLTVTVGSPNTVEIPGASQLDGQPRTRLATEIAATLDPALFGGVLSITDGGVPVSIPGAGGARFTDSAFSTAGAPPVPNPEVFYLREDGGVVDQHGQPLPGALGSGADHLTSVALARIPTSTQTLVAGVSGSDSKARLLVGTVSRGLHPTSVTGMLSRPSWVPGLDEVWVGDGPKVYRVTESGKAHVVPVPAAAGGGQILAIRLSPEGGRVAVVVRAANGTAQLYIGAVARGAGPVRVESLEPISPEGIVVEDVAWNDELKLFAIGYYPTTLDARIVEVQSDGSLWTPRGISNLPRGPDSITVAAYAPAWVSAGRTVWVQSGSAWSSPLGAGQTYGTNPVYLE